MTRASETVTQHWHGDAPEWVLMLADHCDRAGSQRATADAIGYSASAVNMVLKNRYPGVLDKIEERVRGVLMGETVECPVLGTLPRHVCREHQRAEFSSASGLRVRLYRACRGSCAHSRIARETPRKEAIR